MDSPGAVGRRRGNSRSNAEDQALDQIAKEVSHYIKKFFFFLFSSFIALKLKNKISTKLYHMLVVKFLKSYRQKKKKR